MEAVRNEAEISSPVSDDDSQATNSQATSPAVANSDDHAQFSRRDDHVIFAPYWRPSHGRSISTTSYHSVGGHRPNPILLEDHSEEDNVLSQSCWAESATIDDYTLISGPTGIGAYVVWHCSVKTLKGGNMTMRKR